MKYDLESKYMEMLIKQNSKAVDKKMGKAIDMLQNNQMDEIKSKLKNIDLDELSKKMDDFDKNKLKSLNIDLDKVKGRLSQKDFDNMEKILGKNGPEIMKKVKKMLYDWCLNFFCIMFGYFLLIWALSHNGNIRFITRDGLW